MVGASSLNVRFEAMLTLEETASPSLSVTVSERLIRLSVAMLTGWSGPVSGECWIASTWSRVTRPLLSTLTVKEVAPEAFGVAMPEPTLPTIVPPTS